MTLRPWGDGDIGWLARASRDPLVPRFTTVPEGNSAVQVRAHLMAQEPLRARGEQLHLLAVERGSGARVGPVGLHHVSPVDRSAHVGYWTAAEQRGRGLTTAAVWLLCAWALGPLGLERLELRIDVDNAASQRVAEKLGFTREGVLRGVEWRPAGRRSMAVYGLLAADLA